MGRASRIRVDRSCEVWRTARSQASGQPWLSLQRARPLRSVLVRRQTAELPGRSASIVAWNGNPRFGELPVETYVTFDATRGAAKVPGTTAPREHRRRTDLQLDGTRIDGRSSDIGRQRAKVAEECRERHVRRHVFGDAPFVLHEPDLGNQIARCTRSAGIGVRSKPIGNILGLPLASLGERVDGGSIRFERYALLPKPQLESRRHDEQTGSGISIVRVLPGEIGGGRPMFVICEMAKT